MTSLREDAMDSLGRIVANLHCLEAAESAYATLNAARKNFMWMIWKLRAATFVSVAVTTWCLAQIHHDDFAIFYVALVVMNFATMVRFIWLLIEWNAVNESYLRALDIIDHTIGVLQLLDVDPQQAQEKNGAGIES